MALTRRSFFKTCLAGAAAVVVSQLPAFPKTVVADEGFPPLPGNKNQYVGNNCKDFAPQITIEEYVPGKPIKYQDLRTSGDCEMCQYEAMCMCSGLKYEKYGDGTGLFCPEQWNKKVLNKAYRNIFAKTS